MKPEIPDYFTDVNYRDAERIREAFKKMCRKTLAFPRSRGIAAEMGQHCGSFIYLGKGQPRYLTRTEGLGHLNWIAEFMAITAGDGRSYYNSIGFADMLSAVQDVMAHGGLPIIFEDHIICNQYSWGSNEQRLNDLVNGFYRGAASFKLAMTGGETASQPYQVNAASPVADAPLIMGNAIAIVNPEWKYIADGRIQPGDVLLGARSTGIQMNGPSEIIRKVRDNPRLLLGLQSDGQVFGEALLVDPACPLELVEALLENEIRIHAMLPGSGGGVSKIAYDKRDLKIVIKKWPEILPVFEYIRKNLDFSLEHCLKVFNWGIGWYVYLPRHEVDRALEASASTLMPLKELGWVESGKRGVDFQGLWLDPPEF